MSTRNLADEDMSLADEIKNLSENITAINAQQYQTAEVRGDANTENQEAMADVEVVQKAVEKAMKVKTIQKIRMKKVSGGKLRRHR